MLTATAGYFGFARHRFLCADPDETRFGSSLLFVLQTGVLDALVWTHDFRSRRDATVTPR